MSARWAVYAVPGLGGDRVGAALRDAVDAWFADPSAAALTASARRYGCHATLRAPFRLAEGVHPDELRATVDELTARHRPILLPQLRLGRLGRFLAVVPAEQPPALDRLAADLVIGLDRLRAPLTAAELDRRDPASLTAAQRDLLAVWGYPYVLDEYRFHITVTDRLGTELDEVEARLTDRLAGVVGADLLVDAVAVCVEDEPGATFRVDTIHPFSAGEEPK